MQNHFHQFGANMGCEKMKHDDKVNTLSRLVPTLMTATSGGGQPKPILAKAHYCCLYRPSL